ncbi:MAG: DUF502 domain-containing protein [Beijerinckiaceae bacterium]
MTRLFRIFLAGLLVLLPIFITVAIVIWLGQFLFAYAGPNSWLGKFVISLGFGLTASIYAAYALGLFIVVTLILILGYVVESGARPLFIGWVEQLLDRIPIVSKILEVAKRLVGVFSQDGATDMKNMQPVWCFFGGDNGAAVFGLMPSSEPVLVGGEPYVGVMIPTAPVPIGGALVYVPSKWVIRAEGGVETLMNVYISMGVVPPPDVLRTIESQSKE